MAYRVAAVVTVFCSWAFVCSVPSNGEPRTTSSRVCGELENLLHVADDIYAGGEPRGEGAFASLVRLGVKTVVSVDGAEPDVETARKYGLGYVHVPIGYDGADSHAKRSLARLVRDAEGPFYIHCHHGRHRAPAAAAVACMAAGKVDGKGALAILQRAGTSKDYVGLWQAVESYKAPPDDVELPELVAVADVGSCAAAMAKIDRAFANLKMFRAAQWSAPEDQPDLVPAREALLLKECLRELARNLGDEFDDEFKRSLTESESLAQALEQSLNANNVRGEFFQQFEALESSCKQCHEKYRD